MGWFTDATNWGKRILQHENTVAVANYFYQTVAYIFEQVGAIPKVTRSIVAHAPTRTVAQHLLRITMDDLIPLVLVNYVNQIVQVRGRVFLDDEPDNAWLSTDTVIQTSLYLLQAAVWAFRIRQQTKLAVHMAIVTIEASPMLNGAKFSPPMTICRDEQCSTLRFAQGSVRDLAAYFATEAAISLVGYVPLVGGGLAASLSVYHRGRYVLTIVLPDLCNRHQVTYLREHSELALSLGLVHAGSSWFVNSLASSATGIPTVFYANVVEQMMLITQMGLAAHLNLPAPKKSSTRTLPDPVLFYQNGVGFIVDIIMLGLKTKIPRMLAGKQPGNINSTLSDGSLSKLIYYSERVRQNKLVYILLPQLLRDADSFVHDPIISSNWPVVQNSIISTLKLIEALHEHPAVKATSTMPDVASKLVEAMFGTPKFFTKLLLQLIASEVLIGRLRVLRFEIEKLQLEPPAPVREDPAALLMFGQTPAKRLRFPVFQLADRSSLPAPRDVIRLPETIAAPVSSLPLVEAAVAGPLSLQETSPASAKGSATEPPVAEPLAPVPPEQTLRHRFLAPAPVSAAANSQDVDTPDVEKPGDDWVDVNPAMLAR